MSRRPKPRAVSCDYCGKLAFFSPTSFHLYQRDFGPVWECRPCKAWVGCHKKTDIPLGRLADAELRRAKQAAHRAFDPLWRRKMERDQLPKHVARGLAYSWLSNELGLTYDKCHIGMFDVAMCARVVEVCRRYSGAGRA